jgi:hypothetical protein
VSQDGIKTIAFASRETILTNMVDSMSADTTARVDLGVALSIFFENPLNDIQAAAVDVVSRRTLNLRLRRAIEALWKDIGVQEAFKMASWYCLGDTVAF